jgi:hypothetical protein
MRTRRILTLAGMALAVQMLASGCLLFPQLEDKVVELATSGTVTADFHAQGSVNAFTETKTIVIRDSIDNAQVLDDAGIDVSDVKTITLAGVAYRVTVADPDPTKQVTSGDVSFDRGGVNHPLITNFSGSAGATTGWITATLDPNGVADLNTLLAEMLTELQQGSPAADDAITYHVNGLASSGNTDFWWQIRLTLSIVGTVKVKTLS